MPRWDVSAELHRATTLLHLLKHSPASSQGYYVFRPIYLPSFPSPSGTMTMTRIAM